MGKATRWQWAYGRYGEFGNKECGSKHDDQYIVCMWNMNEVSGVHSCADDELGLVEAEVVQGDVLPLVLLVVHDGVALGEGIALDVLPGDTDVDLLESERTKGESLSGGPVNVLAPFDGFATWAEDKSRGDMILESVMLTAERVRWNTTYMALNSSYPARVR